MLPRADLFVEVFVVIDDAIRSRAVSAARRLAWLQWRTTGDRCDVGER
jgi:hypothetical protein